MVLARPCFALALGAWLAASDALADPVVLNRIVAVVNDAVVLESELFDAVRMDAAVQAQVRELGADATMEAVDAKVRELSDTVLDNLVTDKLVMGEAERYQIQVTDDDVDLYLRNLAQQNGMGTIGELEEAVAASGEFGSWADYRVMHRRQILIFRTEQVVLQVSVSDAQVREYYRKMSRGEDARVVVQRWSFRPKTDDSDGRDAAYALAKQIARRLAAGESTESLDADAGQAARSETIGRGQIAPTLEDGLFAAREGEIVGPLLAGQGYEVFKLVEHLASDVVPFEEAKEKIRSQLLEESFVKARAEWRKDLRARAHIDIRL